MAIEFHCEHCGKLVRAPDETAGKRGKCPACHQAVYIPTPSEKIEPLELAPIDETAEQEQERLLEETRDLTQRLLSERDLPAGAAAAPKPSAGALPDLRPQPRSADMETLIVRYAHAMADGDLARAEELATLIRRDMSAAENVMQRISADEIPPEALAGIPRPVLVGFFKQLRAKK